MTVADVVLVQTFQETKSIIYVTCIYLFVHSGIHFTYAMR